MPLTAPNPERWKPVCRQALTGARSASASRRRASPSIRTASSGTWSPRRSSGSTGREKTAEELEAAGLKLRVPGRIRSIRRQGKLVFADLHDGKKVQLFVRTADLPEAVRLVVDNLDLGDIVGASGMLTGKISPPPSRGIPRR